MNNKEFWTKSGDIAEGECDVCGEFKTNIHYIESSEPYPYAICYDCFIGPEIKCMNCGEDISDEALLCVDCNFDQKKGE